MIYAVVYTGVALFLLTQVGNWFCRGIFQLTGLKDATADTPQPGHSAGRWIGTLERLILALGIVMHSWEILAAVIALKTVARFKSMDERTFAEYFLVGSLFSVLWAILVTSAWLAYDHQLGVDLRQKAVVVLGIEDMNSKKDR